MLFILCKWLVINKWQGLSGSFPHPIRLYLCFHFLLSQWKSSFQISDHQGMCIWYKGTLLLHAATKWYGMCVIKHCKYWLYFTSKACPNTSSQINLKIFSCFSSRALTIYHNKIQSSRFHSREALKTKNPLTLFSMSRTNHFNTLILQPFISMLLLQGIQFEFMK